MDLLSAFMYPKKMIKKRSVGVCFAINQTSKCMKECTREKSHFNVSSATNHLHRVATDVNITVDILKLSYTNVRSSDVTRASIAISNYSSIAKMRIMCT